MGGGPKPGGVMVRHVKEPNPRAFGDFVEALGRRYDGTWPDPQGGNTDRTLPRVDHWSIWNEPNYPSWLWPQWRRAGGIRGRVPNSPRLYRRLMDAAYSGLTRSGHKDDTILLGETAPGGAGGVGINPVPFVRELYCLNSRLPALSRPPGVGARLSHQRRFAGALHELPPGAVHGQRLGAPRVQPPLRAHLPPPGPPSGHDRRHPAAHQSARPLASPLGRGRPEARRLDHRARLPDRPARSLLHGLARPGRRSGSRRPTT